MTTTAKFSPKMDLFKCPAGHILFPSVSLKHSFVFSLLELSYSSTVYRLFPFGVAECTGVNPIYGAGAGAGYTLDSSPVHPHIETYNHSHLWSVYRVHRPTPLWSVSAMGGSRRTWNRTHTHTGRTHQLHTERWGPSHDPLLLEDKQDSPEWSAGPEC